MVAIRVSFTWIGTQQTPTPEQQAQEAGVFETKGPFLWAVKKLGDISYPAFRAVTAVRGKVAVHRKGLSLPFPESDVRPIRLDAAATFGARDLRAGAALRQAVAPDWGGS